MAITIDILDRAKKLFGLTTAEDEAAGVDLDDELDEASLIALWRDEYQADLDADREDRHEAEADNEFVNAGDLLKEQWDPIMKASRIAANRPVVQNNLFPTFIQQIVNEGSRNMPAIGISPGDEGTDETAEYFQARIRHVEYECNASTSWDRARDQQVTSARAALRVYTDYAPDSWKQRLNLKTIPNQFSVVWDRGAEEYSCEDADHVWIIDRITPAEHTRRFGKQTTLDAGDFADARDEAPGWIGVGGSDGKPGSLIQVAERICKKYKTKIKIKGGGEMWSDEMPKRSTVPQQIEAKRKDVFEIRCYLFNGVEILPHPDADPEDDKKYAVWLTKELPVVAMWGREAVVRGQKRRFSLVRPAKDGQRMVNFCDSSIAENIGQIPKAPYLVEFGSIPPNWENQWQDADSIPLSYLMYVGFDAKTGRVFNKPERLVHEPPIQALSIAREQAMQNMKAAMGIFDAARGDRSNETSGIAIERRQAQSGIVNYHFPRNENRSRKRVGEIMVSAIRRLDQAGAEYPVRDEDGTTRLVPIGQTYHDAKAKKDVTLDLTKGQYTLVVSTTVNYETARQEQKQWLQELFKAIPELFTVIGDKYFYASDEPGAKEMGDRVKAWIKMKNPGVIPEDDDEQAPLPPEVVQQIQQMQRQLAETEGFAEEQMQIVKTDQVKQQAQTERDMVKYAFEREKLMAELDFKREELAVKANTEQAKLGLQEAIAELKAQIDVLNQQAGIQQQVEALEHEVTMAEASRDHESSEAMAAREASAMSQEAEHGLQREMAERATESGDE
jgi:hypothetical protein